VALIGCLDISTPPSGLSSISTIQFAWPSVVEGDVLRDSTGAIAPLLVEAFAGNGEPVTDAQTSFIVLDRGLRVASDGVVTGDSARTSKARVVAQVTRGGDVLQTPEIGIDVVPLPDSITPRRADTTFTAKPIPVSDPAPILSDSLKVKVIHRGTGVGTDTLAVVRSWIVRYDIIDQPDSGVPDENTAVFDGFADTLRTVADTTDGQGIATRTVVLRRVFLLRADVSDTVKVLATIRRLGATNETRRVLFLLPFVPE